MQVFSKISDNYDCNSYFVPKYRLLIDSGIFSKKYWLQELGYELTDVKNIILTHCHYDHVASVREYPKAKIYASKNCCRELSKPTKKQMSSLFNSFPVKAKCINIPKKIFDFEVISTPGHTDTDICIYSRKQKIIFSGDLFFNDTIGRIFEGGSETQMLKSLNKIKKLDIETVYSGHNELGDKNSIDKAIQAWKYFYKPQQLL